MHTGLRQCGAIGLVAALLYTGLSVFGLGYELTWTYEALVSGALNQQVVIAGIPVVAALSVIGLLLAQTRCSLRTGRLFGWGAILIAAAVATFEGAIRGAFSTEYVILRNAVQPRPVAAILFSRLAPGGSHRPGPLPSAGRVV